MKFLLAAVNAKYIHSNLGIYSLKTYAESRGVGGAVEIELAEYTINHRPEQVLQDIYRWRPEAVGFSCYIWNISFIRQLIADLSLVLPETEIWLGGPEVSFECEALLKDLPMVRGVMKGEGEETFLELLEYYHGRRETLEEIAGITFRTENGEIRENEWRDVMDLSRVPFVYEDLSLFEHKIIYYETSRGCPYRCSYCLSSVDRCLRFRDLNLVKKELQFFLDQKVPQVKFVDRTFNCHHTHAKEIWRYLLEHDNGVTNFHFEVSADLLDEEELELISRMRQMCIRDSI